MKLINFLSCLVMFFTLQWSSTIFFVLGASGEIKLPTTVNIEDGVGTVLYATTTDYTYNKKGKVTGAVLSDIELTNCKYNFNETKVYCNLVDHKKNYQLIFDVKVKKACTLTNKTTFKKADVYAIDDENHYVLNEYVVDYDKDTNNKVTKIRVDARRFIFLTNDKCKLTLNISRVTMRSA